MSKDERDQELDKLLAAIFRDEESLDPDECLKRMLELPRDDSEEFEPMSVLIRGLATNILRIEALAKRVSELEKVLGFH